MSFLDKNLTWRSFGVDVSQELLATDQRYRYGYLTLQGSGFFVSQKSADVYPILHRKSSSEKDFLVEFGRDRDGKPLKFCSKDRVHIATSYIVSYLVEDAMAKLIPIVWGLVMLVRSNPSRMNTASNRAMKEVYGLRSTN